MTMQISEDGKYKWDGNEWIPIDAAIRAIFIERSNQLEN